MKFPRCRILARGYALAGAALALAPAQAAEPHRFYPPLSIENPFAGEALENFRIYLLDYEQDTGVQIDVPDEFWRMAPEIAWWGYTFDSPVNGSALIHYEQRFNTVSMRQAISGWAMETFKDSGCSFYSLHSFGISNVQSKAVYFHAEGDGKKRVCDNILGTHDVADVDVKIDGSLGFHTDAGDSGPTFHGLLVPDTPQVHANFSTKGIFGINTNSVVGGLLKVLLQDNIGQVAFGAASGGGLPMWTVLREINKNMAQNIDSAQLGATYLDMSGGRVSTRRYVAFLETVQDVVGSSQQSWTLDDATTRYVGTAADFQLVVAFNANVIEGPEGAILDEAYRAAEAQIDKIRSFGEKPKTIIVRKGDTLWKLAQQHYRSPYLASALGFANGIKGRRLNLLRTNQVITVPPLYRLDMLPSGRVIAPGQTVHSLCKRIVPQSVRACFAMVREANPGINLDRLKALQAISWPGELRASTQASAMPPTIG